MNCWKAKAVVTAIVTLISSQAGESIASEGSETRSRAKAVMDPRVPDAPMGRRYSPTLRGNPENTSKQRVKQMRNMPLVNVYGNAMGRSATFATAQTNATSLGVEDFLLTRVNDYSVATIEGEVAEASKGDNVAFLSAMKAQIDSAADALADAIETFLPLSGTGSIGQVSTGSTVGNQTITLEDINDVTNFEPGMILRGTSTDGGAYDTGQETLAGVDRVGGVLTATSAAWNTVMTALATSDFLVVSGDAANGGDNVKLDGFISWFPASTPASTAFFGVDRTTDSRLKMGALAA